MTDTMESELTVDENADDAAWETVCELSRITPERGVAAIVDGHPVAIFRFDTDDGTQLYAVDHLDPRTGSPTMAHGLVGSSGDVPTVAAPLLKEKYSLVTGECLTNPDFRLDVFDVRLHDGQVQLRLNVTSGKQA